MVERIYFNYITLTTPIARCGITHNITDEKLQTYFFKLSLTPETISRSYMGERANYDLNNLEQNLISYINNLGNILDNLSKDDTKCLSQIKDKVLELKKLLKHPLVNGNISQNITKSMEFIIEQYNLRKK
jgi:hypothetical protein